MGGEVKSVRRLFRFTLDERVYKDVIETIESIPKPFRGQFIAESVRAAKKYYTPQALNAEPTNVNIREAFKFLE